MPAFEQGTTVRYRGTTYTVAYPSLEDDDLIGLLPEPKSLLTVVQWVKASKVQAHVV